MIGHVPCDAIVTAARYGRDFRALASRQARNPQPPDGTDPEVMRRMRLLPAAALLTAAALPLALAACTAGSPPVPEAAAGPPSAAPSPASPNAGLLTGTQLKGLLEPRAYFRRGYVRDAAGTRDTGPGYQQPGAAEVAKPRCRLLGATSWTSITGISGVSFAENAYVDRASTSEIAQEIDVYRGTASRAVMRNLGAVATACPWYTDPQTGSRATVSEKASPRFAEGGYVITVTDPAWRGGTTLVAARAGTAVVTVLSTDGTDNGHASAMRLASQLVSVLQGVT